MKMSGVLALFLCLAPVILSEDEELQWPERHAMEYMVAVEPGKQDCYYQELGHGGTMFVELEVLKGGDGMAGFIITAPNGTVIYPYGWRKGATFQDQHMDGGIYEICIDNSYSKFAEKLIYFYISPLSPIVWGNYSDEIKQEYGVEEDHAKNMTDSLTNVEADIALMSKYQHHQRKHEARDYAMLESNMSYVITWSSIQVALIIAVSVAQALLLKKMFDKPL